ncbi:Uncharacterised protein [uncultured archaeon]|nr:Uncharacterised protein [uncultured archaeon]
MIGKNGAGKKPVSAAEALVILEKRKEAGELGYEQQMAYDHITKFSGIGLESAKKARKELEALGVNEATAIKISDVMPIDLAQLKHILVREKKNFEEEDVRKMMEVVDSHRGK